MIQIRWNSLNYYTINSRFGAANFHEIIDQIFSSIINNVINSIPWTDSSMCFIVDKNKERRRKKKPSKISTDLSTISTRTKRWRLLISERKSDRDRVTRSSIELRLYILLVTFAVYREAFKASASTLHTHHARLSAFLLTYAPPLSVGVEAARRPDCMYTTGITGRERAQNSLSAPSLAEAVRANEWFELVPVTIMEPFEDRRVHHADTPTRRTSVVSR